jgi:5-methylcytosine-specific restriction protein A
VRFLGPFNCAGYEVQRAPDRLGAHRNAIVFLLLPEGMEGVPNGDTPHSNVAARAASLSELRREAMTAAKGVERTSANEARQSYYMRSDIIHRYVLRRATGNCECCGNEAPFVTLAGEPYLEPHHIRRLGDGGPDDPRFMGAVCPDCHAEIHYGRNGGTLNDGLQSRVDAIEAALDRGAVQG